MDSLNPVGPHQVYQYVLNESRRRGKKGEETFERVMA
jgi:hypothetical protein